ncbi:MAG: LPS-assembly protein LptD [Sphingobacteriales bacterium]|nr:MAG: LPS-assembly protein LptD [Sphingobacteriales bacterium]
MPDSSRRIAATLTDSLQAPAASDSGKLRTLESLGIRVSPDALPAVVEATATDSALLNLERNQFYLYGDVKVNYEDLKLNAGKVTYEQKAGIIYAEPSVDSTKRKALPTFTQGSEKFTYDELRYNFNTKKALVRNARTQYGEGFMFSDQIKRTPDQSIYGQQAVYTTCNLDTPHFGIRSRRIKVIPGRIAVAGASDFEIEGVPTPLVLPFALFPISEQQRSGFRIPSYTIEQVRGVGLTNGGYYIYFSDKADLLVTANIYSRGSFNTSAISTYSNRYRYSGDVQLAYGYDKLGEVFEPGSTVSKTFAIRWNHRSDAKARPGLTFGANVNMQKGNYYQRNSYNPALVLQNSYQSSISLTKAWTQRPMSLTTSANFSQTFSGASALNNLQLPSVNFYYSQLTPFKRRNPIGSPTWYEKINVSYRFDLVNNLAFYDTALSISRLGFNDFQNGIRHNIPISANYTALRYINVALTANYNEYWLGRRDYVNYNYGLGRVDTLTRTGFFAARDFSTSATASTRIYGLKLFRNGKIAGIRHVMEPSIGFNYVPDFAKAPFNSAYEQQLTPGGALQQVSPYVRNAFGPSGPFGSFTSAITYGLNNILQAKIRSRKAGDSTSTTRNTTLIDKLSIDGRYNFAADSFQWSDIALTFRTNLFEKINISAGAIFDPYAFDYQTGLRNRQTLVQSGGGLARFRSGNISLSTSLRSSQPSAPVVDPAAATNPLLRSRASDYIDFNIPWNASLSYSLTASRNYMFQSQKDTLIVDQNAILGGDFNLTPRWKIAITSGYNFTQKQLSYTSLDIYRDLHCFEMRLNTIPFGPLKSFTFTLNVKAATLQDLRLLRRRDYRDSAF